MAKCFQVVGQGVPVRMSDDDAFQVVDRDGDGEYCSKKLWREFYAASKYHLDRGDAGRRRLVGGKIITPVESLARRDQHSRK